MPNRREAKADRRGTVTVWQITRQGELIPVRPNHQCRKFAIHFKSADKDEHTVAIEVDFFKSEFEIVYISPSGKEQRGGLVFGIELGHKKPANRT
jgi:hypothetical protein